MKTLAIATMFFVLGVAPAGAASISIQEIDPAARCGLTAARLIDSLSDRKVIFPEELRACSEAEATMGDEVRMDVAPQNPILTDSSSEHEFKLVTVYRVGK